MVDRRLAVWEVLEIKITGEQHDQLQRLMVQINRDRRDVIEV
jgi:hypothetical protein